MGLSQKRRLQRRASAYNKGTHTDTMAKSFGDYRKKREVESQGSEYIQNYWKYTKIDVETLVKKMDVDHPTKWELLGEVVLQLTNIQQMREHYKQKAEEALNEKKSEN